jgi:hypothetical protein
MAMDDFMAGGGGRLNNNRGPAGSELAIEDFLTSNSGWSANAISNTNSDDIGTNSTAFSAAILDFETE